MKSKTYFLYKHGGTPPALSQHFYWKKPHIIVPDDIVKWQVLELPRRQTSVISVSVSKLDKVRWEDVS